MVDFASSIPKIDLDITGFFASSWIYVLIVSVIGIIIVGGIAILLFFKTYNKKIVVFENISGQGYQPVLRTRARIVKLGIGGEELLKTLAGGKYVSAYGRKMGKNTYWYCKGEDGYWYNVVLGDLDTKFAMLDIEPVDRDVRMFHVALDRLSHQTYGKVSWLEKHGVHLLLFVFLIVLIFGMWFIVGKIGEATQSYTDTADTNLEVAKLLKDILRGADNIKSGNSGITPIDIPDTGAG